MENYRCISFIFVAILAASEATRLQNWLDSHRENRQSADNLPANGPSQNSRNSAINPTNTHSQSNILDCLATQQSFVDRKIGDASLTINRPSHDHDMQICYSGSRDSRRLSCCTSTMERRYRATAESDFYTTLQSTNSYLRDLLTDNAGHYQDLFLSLVQGAHNNTERLLSEVYHLPLIDRWGPTESLFLDLSAFLRQQNVRIHHSIDTFFDELFPLVYHNNVNDPRMSKLSPDYRECLMSVRKQLYPPPFGGIPAKLSHQLAHSFKSARAFLDALTLLVKVLNVTSTIPIDDSCRNALTRMEFCGHCDGYPGTAPCHGYCYNVVRGCLAHVADVNAHWNEVVDALESLTVHMRNTYDLEEVLHSFHTRVSEAIMHAMETGVRFSHKVRQVCGQPKSHGSPVDPAPSLPAPSQTTLTSAIMPTPLDRNARLYTKIELFMRNVVAAKGFYSHLPDTICTESRFSIGAGNGSCWNGNSVAPYNKSVMTKDLSAQRQNPEVIVSPTPPPQVTSVIDDLQTMKKTLTLKLTPLSDQPQDSPRPVAMAASAQMAPQHIDPQEGGKPSVYYDPTNWNYQDYSSGDWGRNYYRGYPPDDEDWAVSGSGSGDWNIPGVVRTSPSNPGPGNHPDDTAFTFDDRRTEPPYKQHNPGDSGNLVKPGGSASTPRISVLSVVLTLACTLHWLG